MFHRIALPALIAASGAFACAASTKCIPDVYPRQFTLVKGDAEAVLVQEYSLANGCIELTIDSIVRRGIDSASLSANRNSWVDGATTPTGAATVYGRWTSPKLDSASAVACSKVRVERHVDSIPRSHVYSQGPADQPIERIARVDPDSVYVCLNDACRQVVPRVVENVSPNVDCMVGVLPPFATPEEAASFLRGKIASSLIKPRILDRLLRIDYVEAVPLVGCIAPEPETLTIALPAARMASTSDSSPIRVIPVTLYDQYAPVTETRFTFVNGYYSPLPSLRSWDDPTISPRLALPSSANAGDLFAPETLQFQSSDLQGNSDELEILSYTTGVQTYQYRGSERLFIPCGNPSSTTNPRMVGDSLRLKGLNVQLSSKASCPVDGQDVYASQYERWLYLPTDDGPFQDDFRHTYQIENGVTWPIVNDSVLVRGQKVSLASLKSFVSTLPRQSRLAPLAARIQDGALAVTLEKASTVRLSTPDGRILSSSTQPSGISRIALPRNHHGLLLVDAGSRSVRVIVP